ncbi:MAG: DUF423 domain-containing protein [Alteromonadaceae bacterium]|nr:DUF423 domain-containing protein [Alteromonadaceae bacterium]
MNRFDQLSQCLNAVAAFAGFVFVALSAYVSHQSQLHKMAQQSIDNALMMHIVHVLLILVVGQFQRNDALGVLVQVFASLGVVLFSFTIYAKYLFDIAIWGKLTMYGGFSLLISWLLLIIYVIRSLPKQGQGT